MAVAAQPFAGFTPDAIQFLTDLAQNNDRAWFQPRKAEYERLLKEPLEALCIALADGWPSAACRSRPTRSDRPSGSTATRASAGTSRRTRRTSGRASRGSRAPAGQAGAVDAGAHGNGGYFNFQPGEMYAGGGMWMAEKPRLDALRRAIVDDPDRVRDAFEEPAFVAWFGGVHPHESLRRIPAGWPADHPMAEMFRWKDVVFGRRLSDAEVCSPELPDLLADGYATALPVFRILATLR